MLPVRSQVDCGGQDNSAEEIGQQAVLECLRAGALATRGHGHCDERVRDASMFCIQGLGQTPGPRRGTPSTFGIRHPKPAASGNDR